MEHPPPTLANGKICYLELPATSIKRAAEFYQAVFGWRVRTRDDGRTAFDDTTGEVSGSWVTGRAPAKEPGLMVYLMVDSVAATCETILTRGGKIAQRIGGDAPEITARFTDPDGNLLGLYQMPLRYAPAERQIVSTRTFAMPREKVWRAWSDPNHLARWWGPEGFTNTFQEFHQKPGGHWIYVMHGPDGKDYKNHSVFLEVTPPERIAFDHFSGPQFVGVATFETLDHQTRVTLQQIFPSAEDAERWKPICIPANEQNLDRLEAELKKMS